MFFFRLFSRLPFCILYFLSDIIYIIMYKIVHYRIRVVRYNLESSFPEKSKEELSRLESKFYHGLSDYAFEALKLLTISYEELHQHFDVRNTKEVDHCVAKRQNTATILGHY